MLNKASRCCFFFSLFLLSSNALLCDVTEFQSYEKFRIFCQKQQSFFMVREANRALAEVRLLHGDINLAGLSPRQVVEELRAKGYFKPPAGSCHDWQMDPLKLSKGTFISACYGELDEAFLKREVSVSKGYLKRAMLDPSSALRAFTLQYLKEKTKIAPVKFVLRAFLRERNEELLDGYVDLLKTKRFVKAALKLRKIPRSLQSRIHKLNERATSKKEKAQALFLSVMFTEDRPEAEVPIVLYQLDEGYAQTYLIKLFKAYPPKLVEEFTIPFREGYGDKQRELLRIFIHFTDNSAILKALRYGLERRKEAHFSSFEFELIGAWQKMTNIPYHGSIEPFITWYEDQVRKLKG